MLPVSLLRRVFSDPEGIGDAEPSIPGEPELEGSYDPSPLSPTEHADRVRATVAAYNQAAKEAVLAGMRIELDHQTKYSTMAGGEAPRLAVSIFERR